MEHWLIDETTPIDEDTAAEMARAAAGPGPGFRAPAGPRLAVMLQEVRIHNVHKLFGGADIRLDALVVQGGGSGQDVRSFYAPGTFTFSGVRDGSTLPIDENGLLIFNGRPQHFLDIFLMASRDRKDTDDLATLLQQSLNDEAMKGAIAALLALGVAAPPIPLITAAVAAGGTLGNLAYRLVRAVSGTTIGMYRGSFLQFRDNFGVRRHPETGTFRKNNFEFCYETVRDTRKD